ncbi:hypothetical protein PSHT_03991 [Puccinia striiformis]|uniref:Uncharacterized protein n=1 Tax=Puccinia striiformis TaxID=27350 RepID=A0A2S4WE36_9BASI|nr:hypothetical protein PSHT_03991 [Puccinia striiformis]
MVHASQMKHLINTLGKSIRQDIIRQAIDTGDTGDESSSDENTDNEQAREDAAEGLLAIFEDKVRAPMAIESSASLSACLLRLLDRERLIFGSATYVLPSWRRYCFVNLILFTELYVFQLFGTCPKSGGLTPLKGM